MVYNTFHQVSVDYFQSMEDAVTSMAKGAAKIRTCFGKRSSAETKNESADVKASRVALGLLALFSVMTFVVPAVFTIGYFIGKPNEANKVDSQRNQIVVTNNDSPQVAIPSNRQTSEVSGESSTQPTNSRSLDIAERIVNLSKTKTNSLKRHLKGVLSTRLGDALDNHPTHSSDSYIVDENGKKIGIVLTSLKEAFLNTPLFTDDIINDFQNKYSRIAKGNCFTYTLADLQKTHARKTNICTSTPHLDPLIQEALGSIAKADSKYVLGFELDMNETQRQGQLVFAIFEKREEVEISRVLIPEASL